jgi:polar amino acid transport system substrate-binding protein
VHNETNWPPFNFNTNGHPHGFAIDYMNLLAKKIGVKVEYVNGYSWGEFIKMLKTDKLDLMINVSITKERKKSFAFTEPFMHAKNAIYTNVKKQAYYTLEELSGKKVGLIKDFFIQKYITKHYPNIKQVLVPDLPKALELLSFEKVDAVVGKQVVVDYVLRENLISSILATDYIKDDATVSHLAIAGDKRDNVLIGILNKAQQTIAPTVLEELKHKWFGINVLLNTQELLTPKEQAYLKAKKRLRICYRTNRMPIESEGETGPEGIAIDVMHSIVRRLDINAAFVPVESREEAWRFLREKHCNLLSSVLQSPTRNEHVLFTRPYIHYSTVIVTKKGNNINFSQLKNKRYAAWEKNPMSQYLDKAHMQHQIRFTNNAQEALQAIQKGKAYYTILPQSIFEYFQHRGNYDDLAVTGYAPIQGNLSIGISKSDPELLGILNKILQATPMEAYRAISDKWVQGTVIKKTDYMAFVEVLLVAMMIIGGILLAYRRQTKLKNHIEELNTTLEEKIEVALQKNKEQQIMMLHQDRLARMGEMIAMIAHQWRQPLNNLALVNQLLVSKYKKGNLDDEALTYFQENSKKQITQMSETIDDFRNFYKVEKEKIDFCVSDIIHELIEQTAIIFKDAGIQVTYDAKKCPVFKGYPNELKHAVQNIMSNARDILQEKEIEEKQIVVKVFQDGEDIVISIWDNAGGMTEAVREKIFDPYFSTKDSKNGTGLGLYMANVIVVDHMNSEIIVHANEKSTEFIICLKKG